MTLSYISRTLFVTAVKDFSAVTSTQALQLKSKLDADENIFLTDVLRGTIRQQLVSEYDSAKSKCDSDKFKPKLEKMLEIEHRVNQRQYSTSEVKL